MSTFFDEKTFKTPTEIDRGKTMGLIEKKPLKPRGTKKKNGKSFGIFNFLTFRSTQKKS